MEPRDYRKELEELYLTLCTIPAPTGKEDARIEFISNWYAENGLLNLDIDTEGNVLYSFGVKAYNDINLITAHMDTVFPMDTVLETNIKDNKVYCPGCGDNTVNLAIMMMAVKYLDSIGFNPETGYVFAADICEEGNGNLRGVKAILKHFGSRVVSLSALDLDYGTIINKAVGSRRFNISVKTKGGHSYHDFGSPNAIATSADIIKSIYSQFIPDKGITTFNVGTIQGGTSVNSIAASAEFSYEIRSDLQENIDLLTQMFEEIIKLYDSETEHVSYEIIGERPCMGNVNSDVIRKLTDKVYAAYGDAGWEDAGYSDIPVKETDGSTDCNASFALGIPSVCFGLAVCGGHHSLDEWTDLNSLLPGLKTLINYVKS